MLADAQRRFARLFEGGPAMVDPDLFEGPPSRIALGLAVHANTVATARLAAMRDSYPNLRDRIGDAPFAALSIEWLRQAPPGRDTIAQRDGFAAFLALNGAPLAAVALALMDQAWLAAYHAADEPPFTLADLAGADGPAVMDIRLRPHGAARLVHHVSPLDIDVPRECRALLVVRPQAEVRILPLDAFEQALFAAARPSAPLGAMLESALSAGECAPEAAFAAAMRLIGAGAFTLADGVS